MTIPATMRAIIYHRYDDICLEDVPVPEIGADELLLRVTGCGLCGSDTLKMQQRAEPPVTLGHELTGVIVRVGAHISHLQDGQRVVVAHHVPCGVCHYCSHGNPSMCAAFKSSNIAPSGFAEYIRVPAANVQHATLPLPDAMSDEDGSFTEPLACVVRAVRRSQLQPGDLAVVYGLGAIGLLMAQTAQAYGAHVIGLDLLLERLTLAAEYGIAALPADTPALAERVRAETEGRGADVALLTGGGARAFASALDIMRPGGLVNVFASAPDALATLDLNQLYHHELTVTATYSSSPEDLRLALDLIASQRVHVAGLISHRLPLERFSEGVALFTSRQARKVYFTISDKPHPQLSLP
jgi:L-iditol 2-dehydrogenase